MSYSILIKSVTKVRNAVATLETGVVVNILLLIAAFAKLQIHQIGKIINADTLGFPYLYQEVIEKGNPLEGFIISTSPNFFPDMPLFYLVQQITGNFLTTGMVMCCLQYLIIILTLRYILIQIYGKKVVPFLSFGNWLLTLLIGSVLIEGYIDFSHHLSLYAYHWGAFLNVLICSSVLNNKNRQYDLVNSSFITNIYGYRFG